MQQVLRNGTVTTTAGILIHSQLKGTGH